MKWYELVLALTICRSVFAAQQQFASPDFTTLYHEKDAILQLVKDIVARNPSTMKLEEKQKEDDGYAVTLPVVTLEPGGLTSDYLPKVRILLSFGEHGREIVTTELGVKLLQCFESEAQLRGCVPEENNFEFVQRMLNHIVFKIFPIENPVGRANVEKGDYCERKNGRGVDINRNWDVDFGKKEEYYDPEEEYPGDHAFSEPETGILHETAFEFGPHVWIGFHSGTCALFMPYDHVGNVPQGDYAQLQLQLFKTLKASNLLPQCQVGSGGKTVGYVAHGTGTDYMYSVLNVPLACTWEIYGNLSVPFEDCYTMFNPVTQEKLQATLSMWIATFFHFIELMWDHPGIPNVESVGQEEVNGTFSGGGINNTTTIKDSISSLEPSIKNGNSPVRQQVQSIEGVSMQTTEYRITSVSFPALLGILPLLVGVATAFYLVKKRNSSRNARAHPV